MRNILKLAVVLVFFAGSIYSCTKENEESATIIGKWKYVKCVYPFGNKLYDYSQYNIVYEFKPNNILAISGETHIENYVGHEIGKHFYSLGDFSDGRNLKIDDYSIYWCRIFSNELEIDLTPVDGGMYKFVRLK